MVVSVAGNFNKRETLVWIKESFADVFVNKKITAGAATNDGLITRKLNPQYTKTEFAKKRAQPLPPYAKSWE